MGFFSCGTGGCAVVRPWEAIVIGALGGGLAILSIFVLDKLKIDDPVGASSVHGTCGAWVSSPSFSGVIISCLTFQTNTHHHYSHHKMYSVFKQWN